MIYFVTKNIERAVGIDLAHYTDVKILTNAAPLAEKLQEKFPEKVVLRTGNSLSTLGLLLEYKDLFTPEDSIIVFKNSSQIERLCADNDWALLNPSSTLVNRFERKIPQYEWVASIGGIPLIPAHIGPLNTFSYDALSERIGKKFILQYSVGHTGEGTLVIENEEDLRTLQEQFPKRLVKISTFINGTVYTANISVGTDDVLVGNISKQLTGIPELTDNAFATVGNDWEAPTNELSQEQIADINALSEHLGSEMRRYGWKGLYGIDVLVEQTTGELFFLEINARQPQSAGYETIIANNQESNGPMDWHLHTLAGADVPYTSNEYTNTAKQVFPRLEGSVPEAFQGIIDKRNADIEAFML